MIDRGMTDAEFAGLMEPLGPWPGAAKIAVAVSGGADSLCLAILTAAWGKARGITVIGLVVDHGLRTASAHEAHSTIQALAARHIPAQVLTLSGLMPGSGLAERARIARYDALSAACIEAGIVDLLLGHHAGDQAETVLMRRRSGSGPDGLAGMACLVETDTLRLIRPLLSIHPERLRATLQVLEQGWVEDPSNQDTRAMRVRIRHELAAWSLDGVAQQLLAEAEAEGMLRTARDIEQAEILASCCELRPEGFALLPEVLPNQPGSARVLAALLRSVAGAAYPPMPAAAAALVRNPRPSTLAGVRMSRAGRLGPGWLLTREAAAIRAKLPARDGVLWDGRFRLATPAAGLPPELMVDALGRDAISLRNRTGLPAAVLSVMPVLRDREGRMVGCGQFAFEPVSPGSARPIFTKHVG